MLGKRYLAVSIVFILTVFGVFAQSEAKQYLPKGLTTFDIMQLTGSPRYIELSLKLATAIAKDKDWWLSHIQTSEAGQPLRYDARMGISKAEYDELLSLSKELTFQKAGQTNLAFTWSSPDTISIDGGRDLPQISGTLIDLKKRIVTTPFAVLSEVSTINNTSEDSATGPWVGIQWKFIEISSDYANATSVTVAFGKLAQGGKEIMVYEASIVKNNQKKLEFHLVLYYDLT